MESRVEKTPSWVCLTKKDPSTLDKLVKGNHLQEEISGVGFWHRFTIINGGSYDKEEILKLVIAYVYPAVLIPVKYQVDGDNSFFLANKGCSEAITKLCKNKLAIAHPRLKTRVDLEITLNYIQESDRDVNINENMMKTNNLRFENMTGTLDLTAYHKDPVLEEIFVPLFVPTLVHHVLLSTFEFLNRLNCLILVSNDIHSLEGLDSIHRFLKVLDLRHNKLDWEGFSKAPSSLRVDKIWLGGNPLCSNFLSPREYILAVKSVIFTVKCIDGKDLVDTVGLPGIVPLSLSAPTVEAKHLAEQFVKHYFGLTESSSRKYLVRMYHQKAVFSMTVNTASVSRSLRLRNCDHNILKISDYSKMYDQMKQGPQEIMELLDTLPPMKFGKDSITIDIPYAEEEKCLLVCVYGLVQMVEAGEAPSYFYYHRTFLLQYCRTNPGEWKILNDMFALTTSTIPIFQMQKMFKEGKNQQSWDPSGDARVRTEEAEKKLVAEVHNLTTMDTIWCKKFLEDAGWDLEVALQAFTDQYKVQQIPPEAFLEIQD